MKEYGVVFAGGGARGSYQIGVWKALKELDLNIKAVSGTSIGAINGAMMIQDDFNTAYNLWQDIEIGKVIRLEGLDLSESKKIGLKEFVLHFKEILQGGGLDISPLEQMLHEHINEKSIRDSSIDFGLVTFSLTDFKPLLLYKDDIPEGKMVDYLIASASLPVFQNYEVDNKRYIDGAAYDNMPVSLIKEKGINDIIVVDISGFGVVRKWTFKGVNIIYIKNSEDLGGILEFDSRQVKRNIEVGYLDALKTFGRLQGIRYYIKRDDEMWEGIVSPLEEREVNALLSVLEIEDESNLTDKIIKFRVIRALNKYSTGRLDDRTAILAATEIAAETMGIERAYVYSLEELAEKILKEYYNVRKTDVFKHTLGVIGDIVSGEKRNSFNLIDNKYIAASTVCSDMVDSNIKPYRRLMAALTPKISITSLFISLLLWRKGSSECLINIKK